MIYEKMMIEYQKLKAEITSLEEQLKSCPDGKLVCARNGKSYKWYRSYGHEKVYIPKSQEKLAEQLAIKEYLQKRLKEIEHEKDAIKRYLNQHKEETSRSVDMLTEKSERGRLLQKQFKSVTQELDEWAHMPYDSNPNHTDKLTHKASEGKYVRSKSEVLIDMALFTRKIPFRYECALQLGQNVVYPDFTIRHPKTGKVYYWEHLGRMDDPFYVKNAFAKLQLFTLHGIIPDVNLITTYETRESPLSLEKIEQCISEFLCD